MENQPEIKVNGWTYNPVDQAWTARIGENRWLVIAGEVDDPPHFTPEQATA